MKKLLFSLMLSIILTFFLSHYSQSIRQNIADNVVRLHIIANSDDEEDQSVKLKIRDRLLNELSPELSGAKDVKESKKLIGKNLRKVEAIANDEIKKNNLNYTAYAYMGKSRFPTKYYNNLAFPCGEYTALKVVLGKGEGHNWWCVMYPPLCIVDGDTVMSGENSDMLKDSLSEESAEIISNDDVQIKFKIVELFQSIQ